jgi:hypothetical protein
MRAETLIDKPRAVVDSLFMRAQPYLRRFWPSRQNIVDYTILQQGHCILANLRGWTRAVIGKSCPSSPGLSSLTYDGGLGRCKLIKTLTSYSGICYMSIAQSLTTRKHGPKSCVLSIHSYVQFLS